MTPDPAFLFGSFRYDPAQRLLFRSGEVVSLPPKTLDLLHVLLQRRGTVVGKAELMQLVWPDTTVEEIGLARNISMLRKAIEEPGVDTWVETVPKRGYRFTAASAPAAEQETTVKGTGWGRKWLWAGTSLLALAAFGYWQFYIPSRFLANRGASIAVVPFERASGVAEELDDALVTKFSQIPDVAVQGPNTVARYRSAGISMALMARLLGLHGLVEGSVKRLDNRLWVTARLVDVHTGKLIWSDTFDLPDADEAKAQADAVTRIARDAGAHLSIHRSFN